MKDCTNCSQKQNVYTAAPVPFVVHENMRAQLDAHARRLVWVIVLLVILLVASNGAWLWYESQFEDKVVRTEIEQDTSDGGNNYIVGGDYNGETKDNDNHKDQNP